MSASVFHQSIRWTGQYWPDGLSSSRRSHSPAPCGIVKNRSRQRRPHSKVRTGCLTCKTRRKKCDELKPTCQRCATAKIKCDGYAWSSPSSRSTTIESNIDTISKSEIPYLSDRISVSAHSIEVDLTSISAWPHQQSYPAFLASAPNYYTDLGSVSDLERHCFAYFRHRTIPQFAAYFDSVFWRTMMIRDLRHPALFSAVVALAAVHQRFTYGISRKAFEYCQHAASLYSKAMKRLQELKAYIINHDLTLCNRGILVMSETLLGVFQLFQGEHKPSKFHLDIGLGNLFHGRSLKLVRSQRHFCQARAKPRVFCRLFYRLYCQLAKLFDNPINILAKIHDGTSLPLMPDMFKNLEEARDYLFTETDWFMHSPAQYEDLDIRNQAKAFHWHRLNMWEQAFMCLPKDTQISSSSQQRRICTLLSLAHNVAMLMLSVALNCEATETTATSTPRIYDRELDLHHQDQLYGDFGNSKLSLVIKALQEAKTTCFQPECGFDLEAPLDHNRAQIKTLVEDLLDDPVIWHHGSDENLDDMENSAMADYVSEFTHSSLNDLVSNSKSCSKTSTHRDWSASILPEIGLYDIAERVSLDGEFALLKAIRKIIPEDVDLNWVDICINLDESKLILRYHLPENDFTSKYSNVGDFVDTNTRTEKTFEHGVWWIQEWWEY